MKNLQKEIRTFIDSLELKELNAEQQAIMLSEEKSELIGGLYVTNKEACSGTRNYDCTNKDNCYKSDNSWNCSNSGNCEGSNNHNTCTGGGSGGTGGGSGANRMAMLGFPGLDL